MRNDKDKGLFKVQVKVVVRKSNHIKELINETAIKYNNFDSFHIRPHEILTDTYEVFLCFNDEQIDKKEEIMQVEIMKIIAVNIPTLIEQANKDFENLIGIEFFQHKEKEHMAFAILKFRVDRKSVRNIPVDIIYMSWSGGSDIGGPEVGMEIVKYKDGKPYTLLGNIFNEELLITSIYKGIVIRIRYNKDNYDTLFTVDWDEKLEVYKIFEHSQISLDNWQKERKVVLVKEDKKLEIEELTKILIKKLESEFNINISKRSEEIIEEKISDMAETSGLLIVRK